MNPRPQVQRTFPRTQRSMVVLALVICHQQVFAHEPATPPPSETELAQVQPPLEGAVPFISALAKTYRNLLTERERTLLNRVVEHSNQMRSLQEADSSSSDSSDRQLAEFFRWQAEKHLIELLGRHAGTKRLEYRNRSQNKAHRSPIIVDPFYRTFLMCLKTGPGPISFSVQKWNLIDEKPQQHKTIDLASGTHYVLLTVENLPSDATLAYVTFHQTFGEQHSFTDALLLQSEPTGHFALDVVGETGRSHPCLLQIRSHEQGRVWEPAGAVDLRPMLNDVVPYLENPDKGYEFYLPGDRRGHYWVVRPPLEMPLPEGDWEIRVQRGLEYRPLRTTVSVKPHQWTRLKLQPERWVDMPSRGWYAGDDHVHARLMDSDDARKLLDYAQATDVNVANILEMGDVMRTYYSQRGFGEDFRVQRGNHWLVPGQEDPRSVLGHAIGLNLQSMVRDLDFYLSNDMVAHHIHRQGGLYGHTHVGPNACLVHREMAMFTPEGIVDFNSIMQAELGTELYYRFLNLGYRMTASAGADTPYGGTMGAVRTYAYTGKLDRFTPDDWFDAIERGHTFVTNGPMLDLRINGARPGDELEFDHDAEVKLTVRAWGAQGWSAPARLRVVRFGQAVDETQSPDPSQPELEISTKLRVRHGCWVAAHAIGHDGSEAHTTPIYLAREGFRWWDRSAAPDLIQMQLDVLDEVESELRRAENFFAENPHSLDYWTRRTAEQAENVRASLRRAKKRYLKLVDVHRDEAKRVDESHRAEQGPLRKE